MRNSAKGRKEGVYDDGKVRNRLARAELKYLVFLTLAGLEDLGVLGSPLAKGGGADDGGHEGGGKDGLHLKDLRKIENQAK